MREIKFRAWDKQDKKMREVLGYHISANKVIVSNKPYGNVSLWDFDLMQYTGLKDKNGKEIYEGDWLAFDKTTMEVKWDDSRCCFYLWEHGWKEYHRPTADEMLTGSEVIGNIYEHGNLLDK